MSVIGWVLAAVAFWAVAGGLVTLAVVRLLLHDQAAQREQPAADSTGDDDSTAAWLGDDLIAITAHLIARDRSPGR